MTKQNSKRGQRIFTWLIVLAMMLTTFPLNAFAQTNGDGYIQIYTIEELYNVRDDLTANYILMNDIDLTEATAKGGSWDYDGRGWNPIGSGNVYAGNAFSGIFDGNGKKIIGLRIAVTTLPSGTSEPVYIGLFSNVSGTVKNLTINGSVSYENSYSYYVGSIAGYCNGTIENCTNNANISGTSTIRHQKGYVGGIVGDTSGATISNCVNTGNVNALRSGNYGGYTYAGGISGEGDYSSGTKISQCYNLGEITAMSCYSSSSGGYAYSSGISLYGTINNCYNAGKIESTQYNNSGYTYAYGIGGDTTNNCYNVGTVTGNTKNHAIGASGSTNCFYLSGTGKSSTGATALSEAQMKLQSMYKGFDFEEIWIMNPNATYPYPQLRSNIQDMSESASVVSIISMPTKTLYYTGDELDFTGGMIKVVYTSGKEEILVISKDMVSGYDSATVGEQTLTVTVAGASDTFTVTVIERPAVQTVTLISQPNTKSFVIGTEFDFTGAKALVYYADGSTKTVDLTSENTTGGDINHIGKQTITYTIEEKSVSFEIEVVGISFDRIVLTKAPDKLTYTEGEELDLSGMSITAIMNNGSEIPVGSGYTVEGYSSTVGTHTVVITYMEKTVSFDVVVNAKEIVSLKLDSLPQKLAYFVGQEFDGTGMTITATYNNGDVETVTDYTVNDFNSTPGINTVIISYKGKTVSFPVNVTERTVIEMNIVSLPTKTTYIRYDAFDKTGLKVEAIFSDGKTEEITDYQLIGATTDVVGTHNVSVFYEGFVETFQISVSERVLYKIEVTPPTKTTYFTGEAFDSKGMVVLACYNNGQKIIVSDYSITGFDSQTIGAKIVTVTYSGFTYNFVVMIEEKASTEITIVGTAPFRAGTTVKAVKDYYAKMSITVSVMDKDGNELADTKFVATGNTVVDTSRNGYTVLVKGDVDGSGVIDTTDYIKVKSYFLGLSTFEGIYFTAGDVDENGKIDTTDYIKIKSYFLGLSNI